MQRDWKKEFFPEHLSAGVSCQDGNLVWKLLDSSKYICKWLDLATNNSLASSIVQKYDIQRYQEDSYIFKVKQTQSCTDDSHEELQNYLSNIQKIYFQIVVPYCPDLPEAYIHLKETLEKEKFKFKEISGPEISQSQDEKILIIYCTKNYIEKLGQFLQIYLDSKDEEILFELDSYFQSQKIKQKSYLAAAEGFLRHFHQQISHQIQQSQMRLIQISIYNKKSKFKGYENFLERTAIRMRVNGIQQNLTRLNILLVRLLEQITMKDYQIADIICSHVQKLQKDLKKRNIIMVPLDEKTVLFFDNKSLSYQPDHQEIIKELRTRQYLIAYDKLAPEDFNKIFELKDQFKRQLTQQKIEMINLEINQKFIKLQCVPETFSSIQRFCKNFLKRMERQDQQCTQLQSGFEQNIFYKHMQKRVEVGRGKVKFYFKQKKLFRNSFKIDSDVIHDKLMQARESLLKQIISFPSLKKIDFSPLYRITTNPVHYQKQSMISSLYRINKIIDVSSRSYSSLSQKIPQLVFLASQSHDSIELTNMLKENGHGFDRKLQRLSKFVTNKSRYFDESLVWYVNCRNTNIKHIQIDISNIIEQLKQQQSIHLILTEDLGFLYQIVLRFLSQIIKRKELLLDDKNMKKIFIYYPNIKIHKRIAEELKLTINRTRTNVMKVDRIYNLHLGQSQFQKIRALRYYTIFYESAEKTMQLSALNSFFFAYQSSRNANNKIPLFFPDESVSLQSHESELIEYVICCPTNQVYKSEYQKTLQIIQPSNKLSLIIETIKYFFPNLEYLVVYDHKSAKTYTNQIYFYQKPERPTDQKTLKRMKIKQGTNKITINQNATRTIFVKENQNLECWMIETHQSQAEQVLRKVC